MSNCSWAWLCALWTNRLEEMANKLACSCIQMTYAQLSLTIMGIIAYVSVWLSVGVFICWVWFGEGKGDILLLMCYILHNSAYPFCKSVIVTEIIVYEFCMYGNKDFSIWLFITHYWEMAVAITCGYGGYLLPLLAAHSSFKMDLSDCWLRYLLWNCLNMNVTGLHW